MGNELTFGEQNQAFAAVDAAYNAASLAQDKAVELRGHIEWLEEQVADRDDKIARLEEHAAELQEQINEMEA